MPIVDDRISLSASKGRWPLVGMMWEGLGFDTHRRGRRHGAKSADMEVVVSSWRRTANTPMQARLPAITA